MDIFSYMLGAKRGGGSGGGGGEIALQDKTVTENGEYTADAGYDGLGKVTVDVAGSGGIAAGVSWDELDRYGNLIKATAYGDKIPNSAFKACSNLQYFNFPVRLTSVGKNAFDGCTMLGTTAFGPIANFVLPDSVTTIDEYAFSNCKNVAFDTLPSGLTSISLAAFNFCEDLRISSLPDGVTSIGVNAFYGCTTITLSSLPEGVTNVDSYAFGGCIGLTNLTFKGQPTTIANTAFQNCTNLKTINVPWAEGAVANAPWGATNATINYNYTGA